MNDTTTWTELPYEKWKDTKDTLHMWMQIIGKVKLACTPFINQWWEVAFYITASGITTGRIPYDKGIFQVDFDFLTHNISIRKNNGENKSISLFPRSVAEFYQEVMAVLHALNIHVSIWPVPVEIPDPIPFADDTVHQTYEKEFVTAWWYAQVGVCTVFDRFRSPFHGKSSPIHFFWGSFDLAGTRFSGRPADPPRQKGVMGRIMKWAENEENFSFGFWPGDKSYPHAAFYLYMYPAPKGFERLNFGLGATFNEQLSECILPYDVLRKTDNSQETLLAFLQTNYSNSADLAGWDRKKLEGPIPQL